MVILRKFVAVELLEKGLSWKEIGRVLARNHASIMHLVNIDNLVYIEDEIRDKYKTWIEEGLYPTILTKRVPNEFSGNGETTRTTYTLIKK